MTVVVQLCQASSEKHKEVLLISFVSPSASSQPLSSVQTILHPQQFLSTIPIPGYIGTPNAPHDYKHILQISINLILFLMSLFILLLVLALELPCFRSTRILELNVSRHLHQQNAELTLSAHWALSLWRFLLDPFHYAMLRHISLYLSVSEHITNHVKVVPAFAGYYNGELASAVIVRTKETYIDCNHRLDICMWDMCHRNGLDKFRIHRRLVYPIAKLLPHSTWGSSPSLWIV